MRQLSISIFFQVLQMHHSSHKDSFNRLFVNFTVKKFSPLEKSQRLLVLAHFQVLLENVISCFIINII